jgi:type I restriction enzyme S subunit
MRRPAVQSGKRTTYSVYKASGMEWVGDIPEHWSVKKVKFYSDLLNGYAFDSNTYVFSGIPILRIGDVGGKIDWENVKRVPDDVLPKLERFQVFKGDILLAMTGATIGKSSVYLDDTQALLNQRVGIIRGRRVNQQFLQYVIESECFTKPIEFLCYGGAQENISKDDIGNITTAIPPIEEQRTIAAFLDRETARIDALIEKKQQQIELLQEKRSALISHAVTKGLDPNAKMKDSAIEGMAGMPAHWCLKRLKFLTPQVTVGIVITPSKYYEESGVPCLRSLNVRPDELTENDLVFISSESNELLRKSKLHTGDVVVVRTGKPGTAAVVDDRFDGANCIDLIIVRRSVGFDSRFMCYVLNSELALTQYVAGTSGAIQGHFNIETASNMLIPVPPVEEQIRIREQLDRETSKMKAFGCKIEKSIMMLREHRAALISAAVTGKIDVRRN